jgi:hypothetical protein
MKIHLHRAAVAGRLFQAYTRDKAGKALSNRVSFRQDGEEIVFKRSDWRYTKSTSIDLGSHFEGGQMIKSQMEQKGAAIAEITVFPNAIHVFDLQFDTANARLYSLDRDLVRFKARHKDLELSPMGEFLGFDEVKFVDTIKNRYYFDLEGIGIDLNQLLDAGFFIVKTMDVDPLEHQRRFIQRSLRKDFPAKVAHLGIHVEDITIRQITYNKDVPPSPEVNPVTMPEINIHNNPVITIGTVTDYSSREKFRLGAWAIGFIGLVSAILTILAYFEFDLDRVNAGLSLFFESLVK